MPNKIPVFVPGKLRPQKSFYGLPREMIVRHVIPSHKKLGNHSNPSKVWLPVGGNSGQEKVAPSFSDLRKPEPPLGVTAAPGTSAGWRSGPGRAAAWGRRRGGGCRRCGSRRG